MAKPITVASVVWLAAFASTPQMDTVAKIVASKKMGCLRVGLMHTHERQTRH